MTIRIIHHTPPGSDFNKWISILNINATILTECYRAICNHRKVFHANTKHFAMPMKIEHQSQNSTHRINIARKRNKEIEENNWIFCLKTFLAYGIICRRRCCCRSLYLMLQWLWQSITFNDWWNCIRSPNQNRAFVLLMH